MVCKPSLHQQQPLNHVKSQFKGNFMQQDKIDGQSTEYSQTCIFKKTKQKPKKPKTQ